MLTIGSLFSGIGGLELGLEAALPGSRVVWQVERDAFARGVLARHWPHVDRSITDVRLAHRTYATPDGTVRDVATLARVDLVCGGFPCQDISSAGKRAGLDGARSGLWWQMWRILRDLRPQVVVLENVAAIATRGADTVLGALAEIGYDAEWSSFGADDVGAPHRRKRWFCLAYTHGGRCEKQRRPRIRDDRSDARRDEPVRCYGEMGYTDGKRLQGLDDDRPASRPAHQSDRAGHDRPPESRVGGAADGLSGWMDGYPWPAPRGAAQHPHEPPRVVEHYRGRREPLMALGNAVVPQCAHVVGHRVLEVLSTGGPTG